jgi:hypothetical protein
MLRAVEIAKAPPAPKTSVESIGLADVVTVEANALVQAWKKWRGWHAMPPYQAFADARLGPFLDHASIARVIDDGRDYEFEFIGDAHVRAYGISHQGRRISDLEKNSPRFAKQLRASYDFVRISGRPQAFQGTIGADLAPSRFSWFETAYLPLSFLGKVGYILNAATYRLSAEA